jgi:uncharacterized membrane protein
MKVGRIVSLVVLVLFFVAAGANHFVHTSFYVRIVPDWLPAHLLLVRISGACEMLGGTGLIFPATRRWAAIGLIALLVAVFPANVQMALHPELYRDMGNEIAFLIRLPIQVILVWWIWRTAF